MNSFIFLSKDLIFEETEKKGALIEATLLELNTVSQQNTEYRLEEGDVIASSLIGVPLYYGVDFYGKHDRGNSPVGIVEKTWIVGEKIKGLIRVISSSLIGRLKKGEKFLFSVGGKAEMAETVQKGKKFITRMINAICNHLTIVPINAKVGFPNAKMEKLVEINETVMFIDENDDPVDVFIENAITSGIGLGVARRRRHI